MQFRLTDHIVLATSSISCSFFDVGSLKKRKGLLGNEGKHDFDRRVPINVS